MTCAAKPLRGYRPALVLEQQKLGKGFRIAMRFDERQLARGELLLDHHRHVLRPRTEALQLGADFVRIQMQAHGDGVDVLRLQVFARQHHGERGMIVDDHAAVAVEDFSARREQRDGLDAIPLGEFAVGLVIADLENPEARNQEQKNHHRQILKDRDAAQRETRVVSKQARRRFRILTFGFDGP